MEEKAASGADSKLAEKKAQETGAEAPEPPQEQSGLVVVIGGQIMVLATPAVQDFVWVDIITAALLQQSWNGQRRKETSLTSCYPEAI